MVLNKKDISNIKFKSNENNIKISFFTNDYKNAKTTQYYYKLEGGENEWSMTQISIHLYLLTYAPGDYTLKSKSYYSTWSISHRRSLCRFHY